MTASAAPLTPVHTGRGRRGWPLALGLVALTLATVGHLHFINATYDDAFISFRYAAHLVQGHGLVFNPGERVEGYTNFLWTVALTVPTWLGVGRSELGMLVFAKISGIVLNTATLLVLAHGLPSARESNGASRLPWAALYVATSGPFLFWGVGGLETPLVTLLLTITVLQFERERFRPGNWSALWLLGAALTRPEPIILAAVLILLRWRSQVGAVQRASTIRYAMTFAIPYAAFICWRWLYYGQLLPNTFYAKVYGDHLAVARGLNYVGQACFDLHWLALLVLSLTLVILGRQWSPRVTTLCTMLAVHLVGVLREGGDWMPAYRLLVPVVPLVGLLVQEAWEAVPRFGASVPEIPPVPSWVVPPPWVDSARRAGRWLERSPWYPRAVAFARPASRYALLVVLALHAWSSFASIQVRGLESGLQRIRLDNFAHFEVARWMKRELPTPGLLAIGEAGVIPYQTDLPIVDMFGLMDPHIAHLRGVRHRKFDAAYVLGRQPDYVFLVFEVHSDGTRAPAHRHGAVLLQTPSFSARYTVLKDFGDSVLYARRPSPSLDSQRTDATGAGQR